MAQLNGTTVLDATQYMAGPLASMYLGDLGAEVIKVERPDSGDPMRAREPMLEGQSAWFAALNRNKHCITLDLSSDDGRSVFLDLARSADVVIENYKPGTTTEFGIDYQSIREINPEIIYCSIKGFSKNSRYETMPAFDAVGQAMGGAMSLTGDGNGSPPIPGVPVGDVSTPMYAVQAILAALYDRDVNNASGEFIEVPMVNAVIGQIGFRLTQSAVTGEPYPPRSDQHNQTVPYKVFKTKDGYIFVGVASQPLWPEFCRAIDREDLIEDPRFKSYEDRRKNREELYAILKIIFEKKTTDELFSIFREHQIPASPINDTQDLLKDEYVDEQDLIEKYCIGDEEGSFSVVRYPVNFSHARLDHYPPQELGRETEEYLRKLEYSEEQISKLRSDGVI